MSESSEWDRQIRRLEELVERFYRCDPVDRANASADLAVQDFNAWLETKQCEMEAERHGLDRQIEPFRQIEAQIDERDQSLERDRLSPEDPTAVEKYNQRVRERNALVDRHRDSVDEYKEKQAVYNKRLEAFSQEAERRRAVAEARKEEASVEVEAYRQWREEHGQERFFSEVNRRYASLCQELRKTQGGSKEIEACIDRLRKIRGELGAHAKKRQEEIENGLLLVRTTLCRSEECYLFIDSGASLTSITAEMVEVLGLGQCVGEEVELSLPNDIHVKAPQLVIPSVSAAGAEAEFVKGVVLKESMPGVDGLLGLSFLNRFDWSIISERPQKLVLRPLKKKGGGLQFDVFICHKSKEYPPARQVFDALTREGYRPFLSEESLARMGTTEYQKAIDATLESAEHLVVVCASPEIVAAPWVEAEWRLFDGLKREGRKQGNIIPVLCQGVRPEDLPLALRRYQAVSMGDPDWQKTLINYLPRG